MNTRRFRKLLRLLVGRRESVVATPAGILLLVALVVAGCSKSSASSAVAKDAAAAKPVPVTLVPVAYSDAAVPVQASGVLSRKSEAELGFKMGGVIETVLVRAGDVVAKGQVLARLRLDEIDAQLAQARSAVEKAQRDLRRAEKLDADGAAAAEALQNARTVLEQTTAQVRIAEFNRSYAVIAAPAAGRILRRLAEPNELVAPGRVILGFAAESEGWLVRAGLPERDVRRVRVGEKVRITLAGAEHAPVVGRIAHVSEAVDPLTRTTPIEVELATSPVDARSGFVVAIEIEPQAVSPRPMVPAAALIEGAAGTANVFVLTAGENVARRVPVQVEALLGTTAYLRTALPREARVVVAGAEYLRDGSAVAATH